MKADTYLITGAGSGLGKGVALGLAKRGEQVIAAVETKEQVAELTQEAEVGQISLQVEKLDITEAADRALLVGLWMCSSTMQELDLAGL